MFGKRKNGVRALVVTMAVLVGVLVISAEPALADETPETPEAVVPVYITATSTVFEGGLNPGKTETEVSEPNEYFFLYNKTAAGTGCKGGGTVAASELSSGGARQHIELFAEGLEGNTGYTVCLISRSLVEHKEATSAPVTFTTAIAPEAPVDEQVSEVTGTTAKLTGVLNPNKKGEAGYYRVSYAQSASECKGGGSKLYPPESEGGVPLSGDQGEAAELVVAGLSPGTTYTFCLVAYNVHEEAAGVPATVKTLATAPVVSTEQATSVGASTAKVSAEINPDGAPVDYQVEYVSKAQFVARGWAEASRMPEPDAELPATSAPVTVSEDLDALQPGTSYRFRFVAANSLGTVTGTETTLTTITSGATASTLPDGRAYELVSTSEETELNTGEPYTPTAPITSPVQSTDRIFQAAANGERVTYEGEAADSGGSGDAGTGGGNQWLATRSASGWQTNDITPGGSEFETVFQAFSTDLSSGSLETNLQLPATPDALVGCQLLYSRATEGGGDNSLLTTTDTPEDCGKPLFAGASEDESQMIFQSEAALTANAREATEVPANPTGGHEAAVNHARPCMFGCNLYDSAGGRLRLVNVLPGEGGTVPNATFGGYAGAREFTDYSNVISSDGSRIFWTDTQETGPDADHVYVLEDGTAEVQVSGAGPAQYWTATPDGRYAYYTEGGELWRFDTDADEGESRKALASEGLHGENAGVQGVIGTNQTGRDGAYVYIVATGVLAENKREYENAKGEKVAEEAESGQDNLYLLHEGATVFIAQLSPEDNKISTSSAGFFLYSGDWVANVGERTAEVTPDGRRLVFESAEQLMGYDSTDAANNGHPVSEVFVYGAEGAQLSCASCDPTGAAPEIEEANESHLPISMESDTYMRRWISADGDRVFFDSLQPLVPQDKNGVQDVYEWEAEGEGTCAAQPSPRLDHGCVFLLSGADSPDPSFLVDDDEEGNNVFFEHVGPLGQLAVPSDRNELYDARVGGGFPHTSTACTGTGCQGVPPAPPSFATPASATFSGAGNFSPAAPVKVAVKSLTRTQKLSNALKACRKDRSKAKRVGCERYAHKKYGTKKAKRAGIERRAK